jgi:hypothetical protein
MFTTTSKPLPYFLDREASRMLPSGGYKKIARPSTSAVQQAVDDRS